MLSELKEEDFAALRGPFESGRQGPGSLGGMLIFAIFLQALMFSLAYFVGGAESSYPYKQTILEVHLIITIILIMLSIIFGIPSVYKDFQKTQYFITILVSQNLFGLYAYISALLVIGSGDTNKNSLLMFTFITILAGVLVFMITSVRFYILLKKGKYRSGSGRDVLRGKFEKKSLIPMGTIAGLGIVYIIQYAARNNFYKDADEMIIILIGPVLFYAMLFVLPEQLVLLYCKFRFDSFNYDYQEDENGVLKPMGTDRKNA